eukprot:2659661-Lingulodinium_polyedra.AAC.1
MPTQEFSQRLYNIHSIGGFDAGSHCADFSVGAFSFVGEKPADATEDKRMMTVAKYNANGEVEVLPQRWP